jgi:ADP-heptose:LPS heptosyltransferase
MDIDHPRVRSFAGKHRLSAILALYNISTVLVTNDSGPAHFSAITPIRSIVLFGPETPGLYGSLGNTESITVSLACSPCVTAANQKNSACDDAVCMRLITPERVLHSIRTVLGGEAERTSEYVQLAVARS